jgi:flagellar motor switch/type III secretory pathway protein FliN
LETTLKNLDKEFNLAISTFENSTERKEETNRKVANIHQQQTIQVNEFGNLGEDVNFQIETNLGFLKVPIERLKKMNVQA